MIDIEYSTNIYKSLNINIGNSNEKSRKVKMHS